MNRIRRIFAPPAPRDRPAAPPPGAVQERRFRFVPRLSGALVILLGAAPLLGGRMGIPPGAGGETAAGTAASFVLLGASLLLLAWTPRRPARVISTAMAAAAGLVALAALAPALGAGDLGVEAGLRGALGLTAGGPGGPAPNTALALALLGGALALFLSLSGRSQRVAEAMACGASLVAFQAVVGYGLGVQVLYRLPGQAAMTLPAAGGVLAASLGVLFLRPYQGILRVIVDSSSAGLAARTLMPIALVVPLALALGVTVGVERGLYSERLALSLLVTSVTLFTLLAIRWTVEEVRTVDRERRRLLDSERRARRDAEEALRAREDLLAVVSHDLRNPLSTIHSTASLLLEGIPPPAEHPRFLAIIQRSSGVMDRLIQDLLDVSRMEKRRLVVEVRRMDLAPLLRETSEEMEQAAAAEGIALSSEVPDALPAVRADADRIRQAVGNLVGNAVKFTPEGGRVRLEAEEAPEGVCVRVVDSGCGIPPEDQRRLFEPFWQAPGGEKRGVGLGLAIVRGIVEAHGGRIEVASSPGEGTTFSVFLPRAPAEEPAPAPPDAAVHAARRDAFSRRGPEDPAARRSSPLPGR